METLLSHKILSSPHSSLGIQVSFLIYSSIGLFTSMTSMGAPLFTETIVYVEVVNIIGTMIWYLLGGFSSWIGDYLFSRERSIRYHFFSFLQHTRNADYNKKQKKPKTRTTHAHFLGYHMDRKDRNVTYIYSFELNPVLGCQGDNDDVKGSISQYS